jgi:phosphoribosyl-AMP cyclohydrolase
VENHIERALAAIQFDAEGLVPAIAQQHDSGEILMLAWMNRESVRATLSEGRACYWSRSRARLWRKGETSGQVQYLHELRIDCDGDTVLLLVEQQGVACHTGRRSCVACLVEGFCKRVGWVERSAKPIERTAGDGFRQCSTHPTNLTSPPLVTVAVDRTE